MVTMSQSAAPEKRLPPVPQPSSLEPSNVRVSVCMYASIRMCAHRRGRGEVNSGLKGTLAFAWLLITPQDARTDLGLLCDASPPRHMSSPRDLQLPSPSPSPNVWHSCREEPCFAAIRTYSKLVSSPRFRFRRLRRSDTICFAGTIFNFIFICRVACLCRRASISM